MLLGPILFLSPNYQLIPFPLELFESHGDAGNGPVQVFPLKCGSEDFLQFRRGTLIILVFYGFPLVVILQRLPV